MFWMHYDDFVIQFNTFCVAKGQESRTGGTEVVEYRPIISLPDTSGASSLRMTLFEDVDLTSNWFGVQMFQGGNRIGSIRNDAIAKETSGYFYFSI